MCQLLVDKVVHEHGLEDDFDGIQVQVLCGQQSKKLQAIVIMAVDSEGGQLIPRYEPATSALKVVAPKLVLVQ